MKYSKISLIFLIIFITSNISASESISEAKQARTASEANELVERFVKAYKEYLQTELETPELAESSQRFKEALKETKIFQKDISTYSIFDEVLANRTCHETLQSVLDMFRTDDGALNNRLLARQIVKRAAKNICKRLELNTVEVCGGLIDSNYETVDYIIRNSKTDPNTLCSLVIKGSAYQPSPDYNWKIAVDQTKPMPKENKKAPANKTSNLKILHLSDFHYDPLYTPGALAECEEPLCCSRQVDVYKNTEKGAGYWSDYRNCDTPLHLIDNVLEHIKKTHENIDLIYYTGDMVDHQVWNTSIKKNSESIATVRNKIKEFFPDKPIYFCIGNHEPHPMNLFSPPEVPKDINTRWLYDYLYENWATWLPVDTKGTFLQGGYYSVLVRPGLRLISINSNDCYTVNWWLYYNGTNKIPQLQWMHDTLLEAERNGEFVHILSHIPSGDSTCWDVWAREYNRIIARFSDTIGALFNGHSHNDEMNVHYNLNNVAFAMSWNGGSLTSFENKNPNYRVLHVESNTMQVVDHETWFFNLTEANMRGSENPPNWQMEYRFSEAFTDDLSPDGINNLLEKMAGNPDLLLQLWKYKSISGDATLKWGCDKYCMADFICRMSRTINNQQRRCYELKTKLYAKLEDEEVSRSGATELSFSFLLFVITAVSRLLL